MEILFILTNSGDESPAQVRLQLSFFENPDQVRVSTKEETISLPANDPVRRKVEFGDAFTLENEVFLLLKRSDGSIITQRSFVPKKLDGRAVEIPFILNKEVQLETPPSEPAEPPRPAFVYGRLLDRKGVRKLEEVQIIILAKRTAADELEPLTSVNTEAQGYFTFDYPQGAFVQAAAQVGLDLATNPLPIRLEPHIVATPDGEVTELVFPRRVILVVDFNETGAEGGAGGEPAAQECGDCTADNFEQGKVLEEFSFYSLVRTSEPAIKGFVLEDEPELTLEEVLQNLPFSVFDLIEPLKALPAMVRPSPLPDAVLTPGRRVALRAEDATGAAPAAVSGRGVTTRSAAARARNGDDFAEALRSVRIQKTALKTFLDEEKVITRDNIARLLAYNEAYRFRRIIVDPRFPPIRGDNTPPPQPVPLGRVVLDAANAVDWDEDPTLYQAVEVAHGHLLQFKSEWLDDGYSLGDLLYSLPLAPGQKKQIVVFDWERRESAANIQSVDFEESLSSSLTRDRDILEIAKGTVSESLRGSSRATTGSASAGIGGVLGGVLFGVSGGFGTSTSKASQDSFRQVSSTDQQKLRDRLVQSASAVRSLRSTVIQTVAQGERFEVSSESVANYNHCHAITIQYYEVIRHFRIRQRFVGARECLFVPLLMSPFDLKKALRWREALQPALLDKRLAPAFDAADRVENQWKDSDFPSGTFASENILSATGVLQIKFVLQRPEDAFEEVEDKSRPVAIPTGGVVYPYTRKEARIIPENWEGLRPFLGSVTPEQFYDDYLAPARDKDAVFHRELGEKITREFIDKLAFHVVNEMGSTVGTLPMDASLSSRYRRDGVLKITLRLGQPTSFGRDKLHYLQISSTLANSPTFSLPDGSYMTVEAGFMRYRTKHFDGFLFNYSTIGDDLTAIDGVTIYAGPSNEELRNPRKEDVALVNRLIAHLNDNLEYFHAETWSAMTDKRRFMLLDGIILNGKGEGRSLASLVENDLLAIVGNSLVFPVAPGLNLNPDFGLTDSLTDFYMVSGSDPVSVSVPTKGVFAEAVMGHCNSCEKIEEDRFWRWEESPIPDSPTAINPISTDSRRADPGNLQPQALPNPIISIQNAPAAPDPTGLSGVLGLLGKGDVFRDVTGLAENQKNALAALQASFDATKTFGQEAAKLEVQKTMERRLNNALDKIKNSGLPPEKQAELTEKALTAYLGGGATKEEDKKKDPRTGQFEENVKLIDKLQKDGVLTPEAAKDAKDKLKKNFLDSSSAKTPMSNEEINTLSDRSKANNTDIIVTRPDGEKVEIKRQGAQPDTTGAIQANAFADIDQENPAMKRTFFPDGPDISGVIEMKATVSDVPLGSNFNWTAQPANRIIIDHPDNARPEIKASVPGLTNLSFDILDSSSKSIAHVTTRLGVPQFFVVREGFTGAYAGFTQGRAIAAADHFDTVLAQLHLTAQKDQVVARIKALVESSLIRKQADGSLYGHNLRLLWQIGSLNDPTPLPFNATDFNSPDFENGVYTVIDFAGYPVDQGDQRGLFGQTIPIVQGTQNGPQTPNEMIVVYTGAFENSVVAGLIFPNPASQDVYKWVHALLVKFNAQPNDPDLRDLVMEIFARLFANVICHEIYHSTIFTRRDAQGHVIEPDLDSTGHTLPASGKDILCVERDFFERTAINVHEQQGQFPDLGSFTMGDQLGLSNHKLNDKNYERVSVFFPLPGHLPF